MMADWANFDIERALIVQRAITTYNTTPQEDEVVPGYRKVTTKQAGATVNVRGAPKISGQIVTQVKTGDWVKPVGATVKADGYTWQPVAVDKTETTHIHGFVALEVITL